MNNDPTSSNPYLPPATTNAALEPADRPNRSHRGPALYLAVGGLLGALAAIPLVAAIPIYADPNPIGYLLVLFGVPAGGLAYRIRSRNWPIDPTVRIRQLRLSAATMLLPISIALLTGMRAQGFMMAFVGLIISGSLIFGIMISGTRRPGSG